MYWHWINTRDCYCELESKMIMEATKLFPLPLGCMITLDWTEVNLKNKTGTLNVSEHHRTCQNTKNNNKKTKQNKRSKNKNNNDKRKKNVCYAGYYVNIKPQVNDLALLETWPRYWRKAALSDVKTAFTCNPALIKLTCINTYIWEGSIGSW